MALHICRTDSRLFLWLVIGFNIVLAFYNFISFRIDPGSSQPCVVIIQTNSTRNLVPSINSLAGKSSAISWDPTTVPSTVISTKWSTEERRDFFVIHNYVAANQTPSFERDVTLTTQGTFEYLGHVEQLCQRWDGPVSVAVYAPGQDLKVAVDKVVHMKNCGHKCIRRNVSWHFVYNKNLGPKPSEIVAPEMLASNSSLNCSVPWTQMNSTFRTENKLPYPINVLRNVARLQARTRYVMSSDIELYPSANLASMFVSYVEREGKAPQGGPPRVYPIPIFEVRAGLEAPLTKDKLVELVKQGKAIFFHKWVCDVCQKFPGRDDWLKQVPKNGTLGVFKVTKRNRALSSWEPIYVGTNDEPLYDERLTWEGKRDKMSQMYELCLKGYDLYILDNAFLVHAPGIKRVDPQDQKRRMPYILKNNALYNKILAALREKYPNTKNVC